MSAGYSGTPLAKKLGIQPGTILRVIHAPDYYYGLFSDLPPNIVVVDDHATKKNIIHYFTNNAAALKRELPLLRDELRKDGAIWISWPKKSARKNAGITEDVIRQLARDNGLVDVKVCAVDRTWSGLKLVIPLKDRNADGA